MSAQPLLLIRTPSRNFPLDLAPELSNAGYVVSALSSLQDYIASQLRRQPQLLLLEIGSTADLDRAQLILDWNEHVQPLAPARYVLLLASKNLPLGDRAARLRNAEIVTLPQPTRNILFKLELQSRLLRSAPKPTGKIRGFSAQIEEASSAARRRVLVVRGESAKEGAWQNQGLTPSGKVRWRWVKPPNTNPGPADSLTWTVTSLAPPRFEEKLEAWIVEGEGDNLVCEQGEKLVFSALPDANPMTETLVKDSGELPPAQSEQKTPIQRDLGELPETGVLNRHFGSGLPIEEPELERTGAPAETAPPSAPPQRHFERENPATSRPNLRVLEPAESAGGALSSPSPSARNLDLAATPDPAAPDTRPPSPSEANPKTPPPGLVAARTGPAIFSASSSADSTAGREMDRTGQSEHKPRSEKRTPEKLTAEPVSPLPHSQRLAAEFAPGEEGAVSRKNKVAEGKEADQEIGCPPGSAGTNGEARAAHAPLPSLGDPVPEPEALSPLPLAQDFAPPGPSRTEFFGRDPARDPTQNENERSSDPAQAKVSAVFPGTESVSQQEDAPRKEFPKDAASPELSNAESVPAARKESAPSLAPPGAPSPGVTDPARGHLVAPAATEAPPARPQPSPAGPLASEPNRERTPLSLSEGNTAEPQRARSSSPPPAAEVSEEERARTRSFLLDRHFELLTLEQLSDRDSSWHPVGRFRIYLAAQHRYYGLKDPYFALPLWVYDGELAPEFLDEQKSWKFYDRLPVQIALLEKLPQEVVEYLYLLCGKTPPTFAPAIAAPAAAPAPVPAQGKSVVMIEAPEVPDAGEGKVSSESVVPNSLKTAARGGAWSQLRRAVKKMFGKED